MTIWLYAIIRNEERILPYFLRWYSPWVDRMIFYDDHSIDLTRQILWFNPKAEVRDWVGSAGINDDEFTAFANEQWKEARGHADWVIWVDADEFLYHPRIRLVLQVYLNDGITLPLIDGYTMISDHFPRTDGQITDEIKSGIPDGCWAKPSIFREGIHFNVGRHSVDPRQFRMVPSPNAEIKLLHYRGLGIEYVMARHRRNWDRVPPRCRNLNYGTNTSPTYVGHHSVQWFRELIERGCPDVI